jgi:4-amino-4-deoxy-L-arabinose transferase-like glycosyltransferase
LAFGFGIVWATAALGRYRFGEVAGLAAGVGVAMSPTLVNITSYGMWADPPMVFCGTLGIYWLLRWSEEDSAWRLWAATASIALAILFKITGLYLGFVVLYLFIRRYGLQFLKQPTTWIVAAAILIPSVLWSVHAYTLYREDGNTFGIFGPGYLKFGTKSTLTDLYIYQHTAIRIIFYHLTPLVFLAFAYGSYLSFLRRDMFVFTWLGAVALHAFVAFEGLQYAGHIGYLLTILPVCNLVAGLGFQVSLASLRQRLGHRWRPAVLVPLIAAFSLLVVVNAVAMSERFNNRDLAFETDLWKGKQLTGFKVAELTRPGSLIIVADHQMDGRTPQTWMTPPDVFFFGNRRGWYFTLSYATPERIEEARTKGAEYFVVSANSLTQYADKYSALDAYLSRHYRKISEQDGIIYDLRQ